MKTVLLFHPGLILPWALAAAALSAPVLLAQEAASMSARDLAARLSAGMQDGSSSVRVKMDVHGAGGAKSTVQLQIKSRRSKNASDVVYQVLWPTERKNESVLLRKTGERAASGSVFVPPNTLKPISAGQLKEPALGSDLAYADLIENFFAWEKQSLGGTETVDRVPCQILDSKPGSGDHSIYGRVRSWIDVRRMVPLRVEKYSEGGQLLRRIDTTRVAEDDKDRRVAASLMVRRPGQETSTEFDGSRSRHDVSFADSEFTPEGLRAQSSSGGKAK